MEISVALATYNGERFLEEQLNSILTQRVRPNEVIISDDNSTDNTEGVVSKFDIEQIIHFSKNDKKSGVLTNFKRAVSLTKPGNYIALSDQDDIWLPQKLETLLTELKRIDDGLTPALVYSNMTVVDTNLTVINKSLWNEMSSDTYERCFDTLLYGNFVHGCTTLMNAPMRRLFVSMPDHVLSHDYWLALIAYSFGRVSVIQEPLALYRKHGENASYKSDHRRLSKFERRFENLKKLFHRGDYLHHEIEMATFFENEFSKQLTVEQQEAINNIKHLKDKLFFQKKLGLHKAFSQHWIK